VQNEEKPDFFCETYQHTLKDVVPQMFIKELPEEKSQLFSSGSSFINN